MSRGFKSRACNHRNRLVSASRLTFSDRGLLRDGRRVLLVRDHEDQDLDALVGARVARGRMDGPRRLVERVPGLEQTRRLAVDRELVGALDRVAERVMAGMAMRRAGGSRGALDDADADLASRQIGEWLGEDLLDGCAADGVTTPPPSHVASADDPAAAAATSR